MSQTRKKRVVGLGELLWDILPEKTCLGGAPSNFAYITSVLGNVGIVASRVGSDPRGTEARRQLQRSGVETEYLQTDEGQPTGTVQVELDERGQARYEILQPVAWDFLEWTPAWEQLALDCDAVCFGSLAQRSQQSRHTIQHFLHAVSPHTVKVFDVNLRQDFYTAEVLTQSMNMAEIVKLNDEELPRIMKLCGLTHTGERSSAQCLLAKYAMKLVCVTRGSRGSLLVGSNESDEHEGFSVRVADTVGAGDAFTAGLVHEYLSGASLSQMNATANRIGAWVASRVGAMPTLKEDELRYLLAEGNSKDRPPRIDV
ncbi:MAG TPA: carbohydrate kinase [Candidatus Sulfotelmatobacter sp.]|nr:carbohydrate kinase [Candidatus Sulfotelmatobacter sp.]